MKDTRFKEEARHGEPDFPMQHYFVDKSHPRYEMNLHWHSEFEMIRVCEGQLLLFVESEGHLLCKGDVAFVGSEQMHRAEPLNAIYECIVFDLNMLCRHGSERITAYILPLLAEGVEIRSLKENENLLLHQTVDALFTCIKEKCGYFELQAYASSARLIYLLYTEGYIKLPQKGKHAPHRKAVMTKLIRWIENNYTEKITLQSLAEVVRTNEKYLCRFFKEYTGVSPIEYVNRLRIERACSDISADMINITAIAFDCGFNDTAYFCKVFKRYKGMTPGEYRSFIEAHAKE